MRTRVLFPNVSVAVATASQAELLHTHASEEASRGGHLTAAHGLKWRRPPVFAADGVLVGNLQFALAEAGSRVAFRNPWPKAQLPSGRSDPQHHAKHIH